MEIATPLLNQYNRIKAQYKDYILMFRLGDFFEMFNEDAKIAARVLDIALTKKSLGKNRTVPLAGIPYHAIESYLARLIKAGYKVAICEQMEDARKAKGLVKREVVRIVTPGTVLEPGLLEEKSHNFLVAINRLRNRWGLAAADLSTGSFFLTELNESKTEAEADTELITELVRLQPAELLISEELMLEVDRLMAQSDTKFNVTPLDSKYFNFTEARETLLRHFRVNNLAGFGIDREEEYRAGISSAGAILAYLQETQKGIVPHINSLRLYRLTEYMVLDQTTQRGLELVRNLQTGGREGTLLWVLDRTVTAMGGRLLKQWLTQPLLDITAIKLRLEAVREFYQHTALRTQIKESLKGINDLERIMGRVGCRVANARDLVALRQSLGKIPAIISALQNCTATVLTRILSQLDPLSELRERLEQTLVPDPPLSLRDGGLIRNGVNQELDELRNIMKNSKDYINQLRLKEIKRTGVQNLKIGYNKVFGYYIEISHASLKQPGVKIPPDYIRKQTLVNAERFVSAELKEKEEIIVNAEEKSKELEYQLFEELRQFVTGYTAQIQTQARLLAELDCYISLAEVAISNDYVEPEICDGDEIKITDGRHPVLELMNLEHPFVPNDALLDNRENQILIITGPNMAGKSTYIRQVALIVLMAHVGSFVPAKKARICIVDRIFSRVGAMDYLTKGQSTFLVEMNETANILNNATSRSLVILDEIGRGTSTYDGLSIAWAVIEHLHNTPGVQPKTLFATHYHEVTELEQYLPRVKNYNVAVLEEKDRIVFLYKIIRGSTDRSYGIYAAQLAGLPPATIERAREILQSLEDERSIDVKGPTPRHIKQRLKREQSGAIQLTFFDILQSSHPLIKRLQELNIEHLTPLQAFQILGELINEAKKEMK